jgi:hypothetical protein
VSALSTGGFRRSVRGGGDLPKDVNTALKSAGVTDSGSSLIDFTAQTAPPRVPPGTRARAAALPTDGIEIEVPPPPPGHGQLVATTDGNGYVRWHFEVPRAPGPGKRRAAGGRIYRIEAPVSEPLRGTRRGPGAFIAKKVIKVLVFPLVEAGVGKVADYFAGKWEKKTRPYRLRMFLPPNHTKPAAPDVAADQIRAMSGKRALLMVHGTFSQSHSGMGRLTPEMMQELKDKYEGRVLAFDHYTISHTPEENVRELIQRLPDDTNIEFDIICHSRGGLVSRVLAEDQGALSLGSRNVGVRKIVFIATPNAGTVLADPNHYGDLVDRYTNLLTLFPTPAAVDIIETVLAVVKQLAVGAFKGLDGIRSMVPNGAFLRKLNAAGHVSTAQYYAVAADYEPIGKDLTAQAKDFLIDTLFGQAQNDQIVPTAGVYEANGGGSFPIKELFVFDDKAGIQHSTFFTAPQFESHLRQWLRA